VCVEYRGLHTGGSSAAGTVNVDARDRTTRDSELVAATVLAHPASGTERRGDSAASIAVGAAHVVRNDGSGGSVRRHSVGAWLGRDLERRFTARESRYDSTLMALSLSSKQAVGKQVSMRSLPVTLTRLSLSLSRRSNYHAGNTAVCESTVARSAVIACSTQD